MIDKMTRSFLFLWSPTQNSRGIHLVNWDLVTTPINLGGLGIRRARENNAALIGKLSWDVVSGKNKFWVDIRRSKYLKGEELTNHIVPSSASATWKGIVRGFDCIKDGFAWRVGNGEDISLWYDKWLGQGRLCDMVNDIAAADQQFKVADIIKDGCGEFANSN